MLRSMLSWHVFCLLLLVSCLSADTYGEVVSMLILRTPTPHAYRPCVHVRHL